MSGTDTKNAHFSYGGFLQIEITPADPEANLKKVREGLLALKPEENGLIILPELWATGFEYEKIDGLSDRTDWLLEELRKLAASYNIIIGGSLPEKVKSDENVSIYNTLFFSGKQGTVGRFRKQHLFALWQEDDWFISGDEPRVIETERGCIGGLVCYDLRFPETAKVQCQQGADLLVVSAQWPLARSKHWRLLLQARAIENQIFVVACNGSGDCNGHELGGHSMVIDPNGDILLEASQEPGGGTVKLEYSVQEELRNRFSTVAPCPYPFNDKGKIMTVKDCLKVVERRQSLGQRVILVRLNGSGLNLNMESMARLQQQRRMGDFLIILLDQNGEAAEQLASLGCVDAVVAGGDHDDVLLLQQLE